MTAYVFALLCLAAYRLTRLLIKDTFPPVLWLRDNLVGGWRRLTPGEWDAIRRETAPQRERHHVDLHDGQGQAAALWIERWRWVPHWLAELLSCPWCASAYVSGALVAVTDITYGVPVPWLVGPAVWAVAALLSSRDWS